MQESAANARQFPGAGHFLFRSFSDLAPILIRGHPDKPFPALRHLCFCGLWPASTKLTAACQQIGAPVYSTAQKSAYRGTGKVGTVSTHISTSAVAYTMEDQRRMSRARNYFAWQGRLVNREIGRRVIEVGCGVGNFTEMLLDRDLVVAVDKEPACVAQLTGRYPKRPNLQALVCDAASQEFTDLAKFRADSCVCLNVLEHIHDDREAVGRMASVLAPGGVVVLLVPAFRALYGAIDANLGHFRRYNRELVRQIAMAVGLRISKIHYVNALGFFGWWANAHIFRRETQSEEQIEIFDRYLVPVVSGIESFARPPFGQSLFAVLQKP